MRLAVGGALALGLFRLQSTAAASRSLEGGEPCPEEQTLEKTEREVEYLRSENSRLVRERGDAAGGPPPETDAERTESTDSIDEEVPLPVGHDAESVVRPMTWTAGKGGAADGMDEEVDNREARLVELVAQQAAKVARITRELRDLEGNGKRTVEVVEAEQKDKAAKAETAAQQLDEQRTAFAQARESSEKAGNQTRQERQVFARVEVEHNETLAAYQREKQKFDRLRRQVEEAEDAATRAEATRTETESRVEMDTSELQKDLARINHLSDKLKGVQVKEKKAAAALARRDAGGSEGAGGSAASPRPALVALVALVFGVHLVASL